MGPLHSEWTNQLNLTQETHSITNGIGVYINAFQLTDMSYECQERFIEFHLQY